MDEYAELYSSNSFLLIFFAWNMVMGPSLLIASGS